MEEKKEEKILCKECMQKFKKKHMMKVGRAYVCKECGADMLNEEKNKKDNSNIFINNNVGGYDNNRGSIFWLIFWIFVFFPFAVIYFLMRKWN